VALGVRVIGAVFFTSGAGVPVVGAVVVAMYLSFKRSKRL
jgi:hypothetical protein